MSDYLGDVISLKTSDGLVWRLPDGERFVTAYGGFGMPPLTFVTNTGYRQSAAVERGILIEKRAIDLHFHQKQVTNRQSYWQARANLIDLFRSNRGGPMTLTLETMAGVKRAIDVYGDPGPVFPVTDPADSIWQVDETIALVAFDPIWRNPVTTVRTGQRVTGQLVFPITFPIQFGPAGAQYLFAEAYAGSYDAYPTLALTGPYTRAVILHNLTGAGFTLDAPVAGGEQRIITLQPPAWAIVDAAGVNRIGDLADGFNLIGFRLLPSPYAPGGAQTITVALMGSSPAAGVTMSYDERYIGI